MTIFKEVVFVSIFLYFPRTFSPLKMSKFLPFLYFILSIFCHFSCSSPNNGNISKTVYIKDSPEGYQLMRNGKPFFVKGASGSTFLTELVNSGGNTVRIYDTTNLKPRLDELHRLGLAAIIDIYLPKYKGEKDTFYSNSKSTEQLAQHLKKFIEKYKEHPSVLVWMLGNEIYSPNLFSNDFIKVYNKLLTIIHTNDPNHPVSTSVSSSGLKKVLGMLFKSPELDFISVNNFGSLHEFEANKDILFFWKKPYLISEWGIHGPWEANQTKWAAPIEPTSTEKAVQYKNSYLKYIEPIEDKRFLGSLVFYWGQKQERTHTWFSLFSRDGNKTQGVYEMSKIWNKGADKFEGPMLHGITLNGKKANENILLNPGERAVAQLSVMNMKHADKWKVRWEIIAENWLTYPNQMETEPETLPNLFLKTDQKESVFITPENMGPYRIFVEAEDGNGYVATANIPFYIIGNKK